MNYYQKIFGVGDDDKLLLLGSQPQQFHFVLKTHVSNGLRLAYARL